MIFFHRTGDDLVAVEAVEDAPRLLGVDQAAVELAGVVDRVADRLGVISWNTMRLTGTRGLQHLEQVPRDGLALAILIGGEIDLVGVLEQRFRCRIWSFLSAETT